MAVNEQATTRGLEVRGLRVSLGGTEILRGLDLDLPHGEIVTLLGPSGSGKTTLLRAIAGLIAPDAGTIRWRDHAWNATGTAVTPEKRGVCVISQRLGLWPHLDARKQIELVLKWQGVPRAHRRAEAESVLSRVGLSHRHHHRPGQLSGGEGQRLAIARMLASRGELLLLDEPFSQLDVPLRRKCSQMVRDLVRDEGKTALHICHEPDEALMLADRCAVMDDGAIIATETLARLGASPPNDFVRAFLDGGPTNPTKD